MTASSSSPAVTASACTAPSLSLARTTPPLHSFSVSSDIRRSFSLTWFPSEIHAPLPLDSFAARNRTRHYWHNWVGRCTYNGGCTTWSSARSSP